MFEYYIERIYNLNSLLLLGSSVGLRKLCRNLSNCSLNMRKPFMRFSNKESSARKFPCLWLQALDCVFLKIAYLFSVLFLHLLHLNF